MVVVYSHCNRVQNLRITSSLFNIQCKKSSYFFLILFLRFWSHLQVWMGVYSWMNYCLGQTASCAFLQELLLNLSTHSQFLQLFYQASACALSVWMYGKFKNTLINVIFGCFNNLQSLRSFLVILQLFFQSLLAFFILWNYSKSLWILPFCSLNAVVVDR